MFFLIRAAFWLCVVSMFLPMTPMTSADGPSADERASIDAMSALAAAGATVSDVSGFCARQPDACAVGSQAIKMMGERARDGAALVQTYIAKDPKGETAAAPAAAAASKSVNAGRDTLTATDRKPGWRNPSTGRAA